MIRDYSKENNQRRKTFAKDVKRIKWGEVQVECGFLKLGNAESIFHQVWTIVSATYWIIII